MRTACTLWLALLCTAAPLNAQPIIDVHRHGGWADSDPDEVRARAETTMAEHGVATAVLSIADYDHLRFWAQDNHGQFVLATYVGCPRNLAEPRYKCFPSDEGWVEIDWLRAAIENGSIKALHEIGPNYLGISISNQRFSPYLALAAEKGIPVGIHTGRGPPPGGVNSTRSDSNCCPNYDREMGNPALLRPVLERHPELKVWLQHVGVGRRNGFKPFWAETLALLHDYPNVYLDLSITNGAAPIEQYEAALKTLFEAGFSDRIMFGADNLPYGEILKRLNSFEWITPEQKRAILFENAARFFDLEQDISATETED